MPDQPLTPFTGLPFHIAISTPAATAWALVAVCLFWVLYTAVAIYHWVKYSHAASVASVAIVVHLAVSGVLLLFILLGAILP